MDLQPDSVKSNRLIHRRGWQSVSNRGTAPLVYRHDRFQFPDHQSTLFPAQAFYLRQPLARLQGLYVCLLYTSDAADDRTWG